MNDISCTFRHHFFFTQQFSIRRSLHSRRIDFVTYLTFLRSFHLFIYSFFFCNIIHTSHPLEQLCTSNPNPLHPSRNLRAFESLRYETSLNVHKSLLIPRHSL